MDNKVLRLLDFPKILEFLSSFALSKEGKQKCKEILPIEDPKEFNREILVLKEALRFKDIILKATKNFLSLTGVFEFLKQGKTLDEDGLWAVKDLLQKAALCKKILLKELHQETTLRKKVDEIPWPKKSWQALNRCLDEDGNIKSDSTPELFEVRKEISSIQSQCTKRITKFIEEEKIDYLQDEFFTISSDRYVLALKSNFKGRLEGIIHDYSRTGETCYFEPLFLIELNNKLQKLKQKEKEEVKKVLEYITSLIKEEVDEIKKIYEWMVMLDVIRAKVLMAEELRATVVNIEENGILKLNNARNPILLINKKWVQPINLELKKKHKGLVISGGNAGGKTIALKTLGLITLMFLSGLPVPVDEKSSIPYWKKVFVILGDEQDITKHLSTFTAQVNYIKNIWNSLDSNTLVILDEFGSGTDPTEGSALAQGLIEALIEKDVYIAVATHFPSLKAFALGNERIRSAAVLFDPVSKKPLYKIEYDQVGASLALDIAKEYGLPKEILDKAKSHLYKEEKLDELFEKINSLTIKREKEIEKLVEERKKIEKERIELKEKYEKKIKEILEDIRNFIKNLREEIKRQKIDHKTALKNAQKKYKELMDILSSTNTNDKKEPIKWEDIVPGKSVFYIPWGKEAIVEKKDEKDKKIRIKAGNIRIWCDTHELAPIVKPVEDKEKIVEKLHKDQFTGWKLDLRGLRVEEALSKLAKFLDSAIYKDRSEVEIIHGRGEGILKRAVHEYLNELSQIFSYTPAPEERGGDGVTLVRIKNNETET